MLNITEEELKTYASSMGIYTTYESRKWISLFGISSEMTARVINLTQSPILDMLCALHYLKVYPTIDNDSSWASLSQKTFVKKVNLAIESLNKCLPPIISFEKILYDFQE